VSRRGLKTGLRYTITEHNVEDLAGVVDLLVDVGVDRFCFYHLDYGGRGADISDVDLSPEATRKAVTDLCVTSPASTTSRARRSRRCSSATTPTRATSSSTPTARWGPIAHNESTGTSNATAATRPASASPTWTPSVTFTLRSSGRDTRPGTSERPIVRRDLVGQVEPASRGAPRARRSPLGEVRRLRVPERLPRRLAAARAGGPRRPVRARPEVLPHRGRTRRGGRNESDSRRAGRRRGLIGIIVVAHRFTIADR